MENTDQEGVQEVDAAASEEMVAGEELNSVLLMDLMSKVNTQFESNQVEIKVFTAMYYEWLKLFKHLGKALVVAFKGMFTISSYFKLSFHSFRY